MRGANEEEEQNLSSWAPDRIVCHLSETYKIEKKIFFVFLSARPNSMPSEICMCDGVRFRVQRVEGVGFRFTVVLMSESSFS